MADRNCFVIRQDVGLREALYVEIKQGRLRQGWGIPNLDLRQDRAEWIRHYIEGSKSEWESIPEEGEAEKRYYILLPMLSVKSGDVVIVPKQPRSDSFLLLVAGHHNGITYEFDSRPVGGRGALGNDYRHVIYIDAERTKEIPYRANIHSFAIRSRINGYQSAVNNVVSREFIEAIDALIEMKTIESLPTLADIVRSAAFRPVIQEELNSLRKLSPQAFEELLEGLFVRAGFQVVARNSFNRTGGDIDRTLEYELTVPALLDGVLPEKPVLRVLLQAKKKSGIDYQDQTGATQLVAMRKTEATPSEHSILVSTADQFTPECQQLAEKEGVILVDGYKLAELLLKYL